MSGALVLVGLSGSGKSTVGRLVAARLGLALYDTDRMIEDRTGESVARIFAARGEEGFRTLETTAVLEACARQAVVAVGGGAVLRAVNRAAMRRANLVAWLDTPPGILASRLARHREGEERPLLRGNVEERMLSLWVERRPFYARTAHVRVAHRQAGSTGSHTVAARVAALYTAWNLESGY